MASFTAAELTFLRSVRLLGRIATVGSDGMPRVTPVGWSLGQDGDTIEVGGHDMASSKKLRDVASTGRVEVVMEPQPLIRIHPERVRSWGLKDTSA